MSKICWYELTLEYDECTDPLVKDIKKLSDEHRNSEDAGTAVIYIDEYKDTLTSLSIVAQNKFEDNIYIGAFNVEELNKFRELSNGKVIRLSPC